MISAAESGLPFAQHRLAIKCESGLNMPAEYSGYEKSAYWHEKALSGGEKESKRYLCRLYSNPDYVNILDYDKTFRYLSEYLKNRGSYNESKAIGRLYEKGLGTDKDLMEAFKWFFIAECTDEKPPSEEFVAIRNQLNDERYEKARQNAIDWIDENITEIKKFTSRSSLNDLFEGKPLDIALTRKKPKKSAQATPSWQVELVSKWHGYCKDSLEFPRKSGHRVKPLQQLLNCFA